MDCRSMLSRFCFKRISLRPSPISYFLYQAFPVPSATCTRIPSLISPHPPAAVSVLKKFQKVSFSTEFDMSSSNMRPQYLSCPDYADLHLAGDKKFVVFDVRDSDREGGHIKVCCIYIFVSVFIFLLSSSEFVPSCYDVVF